MDLEKFENMVKLVLENVSKKISDSPYYTQVGQHPTLQAEVGNVISMSSNILPQHKEFFKRVYEKNMYGVFDLYNARSALEHILEILEIEKVGETKIKEMKIFESASEKLKQAALSFRKEDYPSTFHNLNTALELVLKDKIGIPTTITKINTTKIIEILVKHKVEPFLFLSEAKKRVVLIDNKIKHQAYSPSKIDCIGGIKAMEELISKLRDKEIKLSEEVRNKIYQGL